MPSTPYKTNEKGQEACTNIATNNFKKNNVATFSKHSFQTSQDPPSNIEDDDCFLVEEPQHLKIYLPKQDFVAKGLLEEVKAKEKTRVPLKARMQKEKCELELLKIQAQLVKFHWLLE